MCLAQHCPVKLSIIMEIFMYLGFPGVSVVKNSPVNAEDMDSIPESGRSLGEGNGNSILCSCLENPVDRGNWGCGGLGLQFMGLQELNTT